MPGSTRHITYPQGSDILAHIRNYSHNFQREKLRSVDSILGIDNLAPPTPHFTATREELSAPPSSPIVANVDEKFHVQIVKCGLQLQVSNFDIEITHLAHP
jgi:hypothetical protein